MSIIFKSHLLFFSSRSLPAQAKSPPAKIAAAPPENGNSSSAEDSDSDSPSSTSSSSSSRKRILRASSQLARWSRARSLRSGRGIGRRISGEKEKLGIDSGRDFGSDLAAAVAVGEELGDGGRSEEEEEVIRAGKTIYMVSDGTGWTAEHSVSAALGQFEYCLADRGCSVNTHLFSGIEDTSRLIDIIRQAAQEGALLLYTLADPSMAESAKKACKLWGVPHADILGPTIDAIGAHLGVPPLGIPRGAPGRQIPLSEDYFKRIEAIDFTIKQDDGALPQNLSRADIILLGVSRTGKTPLSIYLAQKGYKVANVPIVMGVDLPKTVFAVDQGKIYALTINPVILQTIRRTRAKSLGFNVHMSGNYSDMDHVKQELAFASKIFAKNPLWPVIEVTGKAIEETAAVIVRIHHDRIQRYTMPRISRRY